MKNKYSILFIITLIIICSACNPPAPPERKGLTEKHNYIVLLDLSDRLIIQDDQATRDKSIIKALYDIFEQKVKKDLYIRSRDEIKVIIAPQRGSKLQREIFEDKLYVNMESIKKVNV